MTSKESQVVDATVVDPGSEGDPVPQKANGYVVMTDTCQLFGFDVRSLPEVEAEWLSKWKVSSQSISKADFVRAKAQAALHRKANAPPAEAYSLDADESPVEQPEPCFPEHDEILRLAGHPQVGGLGAVSVLASTIRAICHAPPGAVLEWIEGINAAAEQAREAQKTAERIVTRGTRKWSSADKKTTRKKR